MAKWKQAQVREMIDLLLFQYNVKLIVTCDLGTTYVISEWILTQTQINSLVSNTFTFCLHGMK